MEVAVAVAAGTDGVAEVAVVLVKNLAPAGRALALALARVRVQVPVALAHQIETYTDENARPMACSSGNNKHWY